MRNPFEYGREFDPNELVDRTDEVAAVTLSIATPKLQRTRRTLRTLVCGAYSSAVLLSLASTLQAQESTPSGWIGIRALYGTSGAVIGWVDPEGPAKKAGLVVGDTITSLDSVLATKENLHQLLTPGRKITLHLRYNKARTATLVVVSVEQTPVQLPVVGKSAPQLALQQWLNVPAGKTMGKSTAFGDGHVYVLDFTATWCAGCPAMYPIMDDFMQQYGAQGLRVMYVTAFWGFDANDDHTALVDYTATQELSVLSEYIAKHKLSAPMAVFANDGKISRSGYFDKLKSRMEGSYGYNVTLPQLILIDGAGIVRAKTGGDGGVDRILEAWYEHCGQLPDDRIS